MKKLNLFILGTLFFVFNVSHAQIDININLGKPPVWGPVVTTEEYYYLPDINSYYDIRQSEFIYLTNGAWIRNKSLPRRYRSYDLNSGYVVVLNDYHGRNPYKNFKNHKLKYYREKTNNNKIEVFEEKHDNGNHGNGKGKGNKKGKHD
jgi:hypothetical protein